MSYATRQRHDADRCQINLPSIADSAAQVAAVAMVPLAFRLKYMEARDRAMAATGGDHFPYLYDAAVKLLGEIRSLASALEIV